MTPSTDLANTGLDNIDFGDAAQQTQQPQTGTKPAEVQPQQELKPTVIDHTTVDEATPKPEVQPTVEPEKVFTRNAIVRTIPIRLIFPKIYPGFKPFVFKLGIKLSKAAAEQREQYLALSAQEATERYAEQCLNEVCDLLREMPEGFGDLQPVGRGPGDAFRSYVTTTTDPDGRDFLDLVCIGAATVYWNSIAAHEFRPKT